MLPGGVTGALLLPPQLGDAAPIRISPATSIQAYNNVRLRLNSIGVKASGTRNPAIDIGSQRRILPSSILRLRKDGADLEFDAVVFAVVVTVTVTLSAVLALELTTYLFRGSLVVIAQLAFAAVVLQEKYTKPVPDVSVGKKVLVFPVVAPAFTLIAGGVPSAGAGTAEA